MKTREEKQRMIEELREKFSSCALVVLTDFHGMTVAETTQLRRILRDAGGEYKVVKNTIARIASEGTPLSEIVDKFIGPTGVVFSKDDPVSIAKALRDFIKENEKLKIKAAVVEGKLAGESDIQSLASIPSREELISQLAFTLRYPVNGFVWSLENIISKLVFTLENVKSMKEAA